MTSTKKSTFAWVLYDWANSAFATTVVAGFFPLFFKQYWSAGHEATTSTFYLGLANALGSMVIVILAPILGAIADCGGYRKKFLGLFAFLGITMTSSLFWVKEGYWEFAAAFYALAAIGFSGSITFYDSLLPSVVAHNPKKMDWISALGFSVGYLGGGLLFALNVVMFLKPEMFGFEDGAQAIRASFLSVALWWGLFSLPLFFWVPEERGEHPSLLQASREGLARLRTTFKKIRSLKVTFTFLIAYWLYIDGVDTIIRMAVDYGLALGFPADSLITALLLVQFIGFPAALAFGKLGEKYGPKFGLYIGITGYTFITLGGAFMTTQAHFYGLAIAIALVQGGVQSLSRSLFARLIPRGQSAEFFGFFNIIGKAAAVMGPLMMSLVIMVTGSHRLSLLSIVIFFVVGGLLLARVDLKEGERAAQSFS